MCVFVVFFVFQLFNAFVLFQPSTKFPCGCSLSPNVFVFFLFSNLFFTVTHNEKKNDLLTVAAAAAACVCGFDLRTPCYTITHT